MVCLVCVCVCGIDVKLGEISARSLGGLIKIRQIYIEGEYNDNRKKPIEIISLR